jgi:TRAP-type C4-dicarboxylate transport system permease small subunit
MASGESLKKNLQHKHQKTQLFNKLQRNIIIALIGAIIVANSFIILAQGEERVFFSNWTINITAGVAFAFAVITVYRQKLDGLFGKTYASLTIGLGLWFVAELIWTYFEIGLQIDTPFPSLADVFWLVAYAFFAYPLYRIYNFMSKETIQSTVVIIVTVAIAIALGYLVNLTINVSEISYSQKQQSEDIILLLVSIAYPILDGLLLVPAVLVLWAVRTGQLPYTHWMLLSLSMLLFAVADSGFGYAAVSDINMIQNEGWIWDIFYNAGYLSIAAALFWHNRFFVFDENREQKSGRKRIVR